MNGKPSKLVPALVGGVFIGVTSALPILEFLNCACCMLVIGGGVLATYMYLREYPAGLPPITYGEGAGVGVLAGIVGGFVWSFVGIPLLFIKTRMGMGFGDVGEIQEALSDPEIPPFVREILEGLFTGGGMSLLMILTSIVTYFMVSIIFATLGGILGVALFQKKAPPVAAAPPPPPVVPSPQQPPSSPPPGPPI